MIKVTYIVFLLVSIFKVSLAQGIYHFGYVKLISYADSTISVKIKEVYFAIDSVERMFSSVPGRGDTLLMKGNTDLEHLCAGGIYQIVFKYLNDDTITFIYLRDQRKSNLALYDKLFGREPVEKVHAPEPLVDSSD